MAKDPAFLFYPGDWLGGTMTFTRYHKGAYMDLLMAQFNYGHMALHDVRIILGDADFEAMWESKLKFKFKQDKDGLFYNEKLENESIKRKKFTESRKKNLSQVDTHKESHMTSHMENGDLIRIIISYYDAAHLLNGEPETEKNEIGMVVLEMLKIWMRERPGYSHMKDVDYPALLKIAYLIAEKKGWTKESVTNFKERDILGSWQKITSFLSEEKTDKFLKRLTVDGLAIPKNFQKVEEAMKGSDFYKNQRAKEMEKNRIPPEKYFTE